jgi:serine/threonine-protein kinase RsbW
MSESASSAAGAVVLQIPASSAYLSLARAATTSVCARLDFQLDQLEDITLAVDEALSLILLDAAPGSEISCRWDATATGLAIDITARGTSGRPPRRTTFAWAVLSALVDDVSATIDDGLVTISLSAGRSGAVVR